MPPVLGSLRYGHSLLEALQRSGTIDTILVLMRKRSPESYPRGRYSLEAAHSLLLFFYNQSSLSLRSSSQDAALSASLVLVPHSSSTHGFPSSQHTYIHTHLQSQQVPLCLSAPSQGRPWIRHLFPLGKAMKNEICCMSASDMPSAPETAASGYVRKKRAVARRSSMRARCRPRQTR